MTDDRLPGGFVNAVVRSGDTVRRPVPAQAEFVGQVLRYFEHAGWPGAPRYLGVDGDGRQVLEYLEGHVAWEPAQPAAVTSAKSLLRVATLVREFHDLTAGSGLAGDCEVICHNDLSPKNTVYRDDGQGFRPIAFIDWDLAAPGCRIHDVAHLCWQYLGMGPGADTSEVGHLIGLISDSYRLPSSSGLLETVLWWQDRCWRGIESAADAGDSAMIGLRDTGVVREVQDAYQWTLASQSEIERALSAAR